MSQYRLSPLAEHDLEAILAWTHERFGDQGRIRYQALIGRAILDVADNPRRSGCQSRPELAPGAMSYHLLHSRNRVSKAAGRVRKPRHLLLFRIAADGTVEIARVLHDSMDLDQHLPERRPL